MTEAEYRARFGCEPVQDDLERVNCERAGQLGHMTCGVCERHQQPQFMCMCAVREHAHMTNGN